MSVTDVQERMRMRPLPHPFFLILGLSESRETLNVELCMGRIRGFDRANRPIHEGCTCRLQLEPYVPLVIVV